MLKDVDNGYNMLLIKLPKSVRQMPWIELFSEFTKTVGYQSNQTKIPIHEMWNTAVFHSLNMLNDRMICTGVTLIVLSLQLY